MLYTVVEVLNWEMSQQQRSSNAPNDLSSFWNVLCMQCAKINRNEFNVHLCGSKAFWCNKATGEYRKQQQRGKKAGKMYKHPSSTDTTPFIGIFNLWIFSPFCNRLYTLLLCLILFWSTIKKHTHLLQFPWVLRCHWNSITWNLRYFFFVPSHNKIYTNIFTLNLLFVGILRIRLNCAFWLYKLSLENQHHVMAVYVQCINFTHSMLPHYT